MKIRNSLATAASCAVLAFFAAPAAAQDKPKLDANGMPCNFSDECQSFACSRDTGMCIDEPVCI